MDEISRKTKKSVFKVFSGVKAWNSSEEAFKKEFAPPGSDLRKVPANRTGLRGQEVRPRRHGRHLQLSHTDGRRHALHGFLQLRRRSRKALPHSLRGAQWTLYPFCTYNSGPVFRDKIERKYSVSLESYEEKAKSNGNGCRLKGRLRFLWRGERIARESISVHQYFSISVAWCTTREPRDTDELKY